jgi:membrane fusion protein, multidrug efflux system
MTMTPSGSAPTPTGRAGSAPAAPVPPPPSAPEAAPTTPRRRRALWAGLAAALVATGSYGAWLYATRFDESTDDAQVEADVVPLATRVGGEVAQVLVRENQAVRRGDLLVVIDHADLAAKVRQAEAELEIARAQAVSADAQVAAADAGLRRAGVEAEKAEQDLERAEVLSKGEVIPPDKLEAAQATGGVSRAAVASARAQRVAAGAQARLAHARVKAAEAALDLSRLQLSYSRLWAPEDGVVSKLTVRPGQLVAPGQPVAELVPDDSYVTANFKETQVGRMRPGQRAEVRIDAYPGLRLEGTVESLSGGTGSRFTLIPPDNASGNFVKVVERVPVRVAWERPPPPRVRLRAGLSAYVTVHER